VRTAAKSTAKPAGKAPAARASAAKAAAPKAAAPKARRTRQARSQGFQGQISGPAGRLDLVATLAALGGQLCSGTQDCEPEPVGLGDLA